MIVLSLWKGLIRAPVDPSPAIISMAETVAAERRLGVREVLGRSKHRYVSLARHEAMYRAREELGVSLPQIARVFNRDHSTVYYACRAHAARLEAR